jgi:hypothetical protein
MTNKQDLRKLPIAERRQRFIERLAAGVPARAAARSLGLNPSREKRHPAVQQAIQLRQIHKAESEPTAAPTSTPSKPAPAMPPKASCRVCGEPSFYNNNAGNWCHAHWYLEKHKPAPAAPLEPLLEPPKLPEEQLNAAWYRAVTNSVAPERGTWDPVNGVTWESDRAKVIAEMKNKQQASGYSLATDEFNQRWEIGPYAKNKNVR